MANIKPVSTLQKLKYFARPRVTITIFITLRGWVKTANPPLQPYKKITKNSKSVGTIQ
jgi:hypothetical protein